MKCIYYLTPTLDSTQHISDDLHEAGIKDWFFHVICKDESGLKKEHVHSSNYLETLDLLRDGIIGAVTGFMIGLIVVGVVMVLKLFGPDAPIIIYFAIVVLLTLFGAWEGGLTGIASRNKKIVVFQDDIEAGKYLILIYVRQKEEDTVKTVIANKHPEAQLVAIDKHFFNPLASLKRQ